MQRAVTAIYRSADVAELVRQEVEQLGIGRHNVTILSGTGTAGGLDELYDLGLPEQDIRTYSQALQNGDYVVSVEVDDETHLGQVQEIMRRPEEAYDLDELDTRYADADFTPRQPAAYADTGATDYRASDLNEDGTVKVVEERLNVGKREVEGGAVRVRSYVREVPVEAEVELRNTRVYIERRPVDRAVAPGDVQFGDRVLEAREHREEAVVAKEARVVEEIGLRKETEVEHAQIQETVRKTEVEIEDERTGERGSITGGTTGTSGRSSSDTF